MRKISTITRHRNIIKRYCRNISNNMDREHALSDCALYFGLRCQTVIDVMNSNDKYFKKIRSELSKCKIKIAWYLKN